MTEARRPSRIECSELAKRVATESVIEQQAHGGSGDDGVIYEAYDTRVEIAEALEASARAIGDKPVERADAAAIRVAEASALGGDAVAGRGGATPAPGGVAKHAQAAAAANARAARDEDRVTMTDVLTWESTMKLSTGKSVTSEVAAAAAEAEVANDPRGKTNPRGVSAALDVAAKHNSNTSARLE